MGPHVFLYADEADPSVGEVALMPGFRIVFTRRGLPDLEPDRDHAAPGILTAATPPPLVDPYRCDQGHAVRIARGVAVAVVPVLLRRQVPGGHAARPERELMELVRGLAERCGFPLAWVTEGAPLSRMDAAYGHAVGARVRSVADRVSRGFL